MSSWKPKVSAYIPSADNTCKVFHDLEKYPVSLHPIYNNRRSLCEVYNECIRNSIEKGDDLIILCHNDIIIESNNLIDKLLDFDVTGVAGASTVKLEEPALWHIMGGKDNLRGAVAHSHGTRKMMTSFGPYPARTVILDGVFLAIKRNVFTKLQFREDNPAKFHFYDLSYTLEAHQKGFKVGVGDILITHESPGLREFSPEWLSGQKWFLDTYGNRD